ncbi:MAG: GatB/YqeY domain-containing protein [Candidatus Paceibacterota bacterium]|jgi:hypothetical protein
MLHQQIKEEVKKSMLARDTERLTAARNILASFTNELVAKKQKPDEILPDDDALTVLKRLAKQRKDSIEQFTLGNRPEMAAAETKELAFIESFLPAQMSHEEIKKIAEQKKTELGINDKSQLGQLMGIVMKETKGQADGLIVKEILEGLF